MFELVLRAPRDLVEPVSDLLGEELQALSVSVEDADADTDQEQALFGEPGLPAPQPGWMHSTLRALFEDSAAAEGAAATLLSVPALAGVQVQAIVAVADQDWVRLTQSQFDPIEITPDFWVVPSWHQPPRAARLAIRLDPGLAFGTGTHATTRMCLRWIAREAGTRLAGKRVLDYGCGSGILAIAAAMHGAREVQAVDIDEAAIRATADNARNNGIAVDAGLPDIARGPSDVVLANILATPLRLLAPLLCGHVAHGGSLVLAGILTRQADELVAAYAPWLPMRVSDEEQGWVLLTGTRGGMA